MGLALDGVETVDAVRADGSRLSIAVTDNGFVEEIDGHVVELTWRQRGGVAREPIRYPRDLPACGR
jgi:hypothetical protein